MKLSKHAMKMKLMHELMFEKPWVFYQHILLYQSLITQDSLS